jgi:hypothetical protein
MCKMVSVAQCSGFVFSSKKKELENYYIHVYCTCECTLCKSSQNTLTMSFEIFRNGYLLHFKFGFVSWHLAKNQHKFNPFLC